MISRVTFSEEELSCVATWKEGSARYLVGRLWHRHATSDEERYRCFVYEKAGGEPELQQTAAAAAPRASHVGAGDSPSSSSSNSGEHDLHEDGTWHGGDARLACVDVRGASAHRATIVAHLTYGCHNGFVCLAFYRRDPHVVELQRGTTAKRAEDACSSQHFDAATLPFTTLVKPRECPHAGRFSVSGSPVLSPVAGAEKQTTGETSGGSAGCAPDFTSLAVGCGALDTMEFRSPECAVQPQQQPAAASYSCHGGWEDNGTHFLITTPLSRTSHGARRLCFMFRAGHAAQLLLSSSAASCTREQHVQQAAAQLTLTSHGECLVASNAAITSPVIMLLVLAATLALPSLRPHFLS
ncbi:hypothetical protein B566_EDAN008259 [Ephemera danica]|nr:hypothetical protein B566_EDAN008259 [Ephemera danica]